MPPVTRNRRIGRTLVWIFHGAEDYFVPVRSSRAMQAALVAVSKAIQPSLVNYLA